MLDDGGFFLVARSNSPDIFLSSLTSTFAEYTVRTTELFIVSKRFSALAGAAGGSGVRVGDGAVKVENSVEKNPPPGVG